MRIELWWKSSCCFANIVKSCFANTFSAWSFKLQNYCDNESISVIFATLNSAHSTLQCWLDEWKSYVILDWSARCETTVQTTKIERNKEFWWLIEWNIIVFLFENLNSQLMKVIDFKKYEREINQNSSRLIIRVQRIYWTFFYRMCSI